MNSFAHFSTPYTNRSFGVHKRNLPVWVQNVVVCGAIALGSLPQAAIAQSIVVAPDGTGTVVTQTGDRFVISGGTSSANGHNLFHSFEQFGLQSHEIADFLANPTQRNILARVVGGNPSIIDGLLKVSGGNPHLYLMNPTGIVFGANAQLNIGGDFTATTATSIEFAEGDFSGTSPASHYATLGSTPQAFHFEQNQSGAIVNAGHLQVKEGQNLSLVGNTVLNTGMLTAKGGSLQVVGVPGTNRVKISQPGTLLSLEVEPALSKGVPQAITPLDLPQLLTGGGITPESVGVEFRDDGLLYAPGATVPIPTSAGSVTVTGKVDASSTQSLVHLPQIKVTGDRVALFGAEINASGDNGGGNIRIGTTSKRTFVDRNSSIRADALGPVGNGGDTLIWADEATAFYGELSAQGGTQGGDGGFVEVSAKGSLAYDGRAHLDAPQGQVGTLFLDPTNITIGGAGPDDAQLPNIFASQDPGVDYFISGAALAAETGTVILEATNSITVNSSMILSSPHLILRAPAIAINGSMQGTSFTIAADGTAIGNNIVGDNNIGTLTITTFSPDVGLNLGGTTGSPGVHDIPDSEIALFSNFANVTLGDASRTGNLSTVDSPTVRALLPLANFTIAGSGSLQGVDQDTTWNLTGANQGNFNLFGQTINFQNVGRINGGNAQDTFVFNDGVNFNGVLDGGGGSDRLDYSNYTSMVAVDLAANFADGTTGVFNIESVTLPNNVQLPPTVTNPNLTPITPLDSGWTVIGDSGSNDDGVAVLDRDAIGQLLNGDDLEGAIVGIETLFGSEVLDYLGKSGQGKSSSLREIQGILQEQSLATGSPSAMIYALVRPEYLELILVTEIAEPIHYQVPVLKANLLQTVNDFRQEVTDPVRRLTTSYLPLAQQLHDWIMEPLQADLNRFGIETLIFSLDQGLRTLPLAALHDGSEFLIEDYGMSVVPSLALTRTERTPLQEARVLAMGASQFTYQQPLPAVPVEIAAVTDQIRHGVGLVNEQFTWANWQEQQQHPFNVVHIATHAEFRPGTVDNSYIQLWDGPITLDQVGQIPWQDQNVELLVLSACRTALGSHEAEFGFAGLVVQTGVPAAIASIWYANDLGTLGLMNELYRALPNTNTRAGALRQAQLSLLNRRTRLQDGSLVNPQLKTALPDTLSRFSDRSFHHPYYWSGFTLIGSPW